VTTTATLPAQTTIGRVELTVAELEPQRVFYERVVGLPTLFAHDGTAVVGVDHDAPAIELDEVPGAPAPHPRSTGLFHLAILVPSRRDLALSLRRIAEARWPLSGASDHLVSEAIYLRDPEGNGIEIYSDRPREQWPRAGDGIQIDTLPLDIESVLGELDGSEGEPGPMPPGTRMGHVHLKVSDLPAAEAFYVGVLGFDVTARVPGACFVSAGGYHHHIGFNVWSSQGGSPPRPGTRGLRAFEVVLPSAEDLEEVHDRFLSAGVPAERSGDGLLTVDPSGNHLLLVCH
jgi:catechol 2,3-dioxygenase